MSTILSWVRNAGDRDSLSNVVKQIAQSNALKNMSETQYALFKQQLSDKKNSLG